MKNAEGKKIPTAKFRTRKNGKWGELSTDALFKNKRVAVFSLPGAFTPTCSSAHVPRYNELAHCFRENGIDEIVCISVNDAFVMEAWQTEQQAWNITFVPDGNGEFTEAMGMLVAKEDLGFGKRSWRYSMIVDDHVIEKMFIEAAVEGDPFDVSDADTMISYINPGYKLPPAVAIFTKKGCPHCNRAKAALEERGITFEEIAVDGRLTSTGLRAVTSHATVPQVFVDGQRIGSADELERYLSA